MHAGNYGNSMDGQNQSVGKGTSSSDEEEEEEDEEGGAQEEDASSVQQAEPEWKSTTDAMKPTTTDRSVHCHKLNYGSPEILRIFMVCFSVAGSSAGLCGCQGVACC